MHYTAVPDIKDSQLGAYTGYFHSSGELLNRLWYAGAHTSQLCTVGANISIDHTYLSKGGGGSSGSKAFNLSATDAYLSDGAKRDRNPWTGDVEVSLRTAMVTQQFDNLRSVRNSSQEMIILQDKNSTSPTRGYFPYAVSPLGDLLIRFGATGKSDLPSIVYC